MTTKLLKPVRREMRASSALGKYRGRPLICEMLPGDVMRFRIKGTRVSYEVSLHSCYRLAQIASFERMYQEKMRQYKIKREAGYRVKRPKKISFPVDKAMLSAL